MHIFVTGASGFVGRAVLERLRLEKEVKLFAAVRRSVVKPVRDVAYVNIGDLASQLSWKGILVDVDVVIHTAGRVHQVRDAAADPLEEFRRVNVAATIKLAREAADSGVRRFVFISSIKVNGEFTSPGKAFVAEDTPAPVDAYGISKFEAEVALQELSRVTDMEVVVIRPPLVYGPGVRANFLAMMRWIYRGWPVPLARVNNKRSLVALDNLTDLIATCTSHPAAANQTFTVSDDEDVSTSELVRRIGIALQRPARLVPIPVALLRTFSSLAGKGAQAERLLSSLQVDIGKTRNVLGWSPVTSMNTALQNTASCYLKSVRR